MWRTQRVPAGINRLEGNLPLCIRRQLAAQISIVIRRRLTIAYILRERIRIDIVTTVMTGCVTMPEVDVNAGNRLAVFRIHDRNRQIQLLAMLAFPQVSAILTTVRVSRSLCGSVGSVQPSSSRKIAKSCRIT